jgi:hypothetical protein
MVDLMRSLVHACFLGLLWQRATFRPKREAVRCLGASWPAFHPGKKSYLTVRGGYRAVQTVCEDYMLFAMIQGGAVLVYGRS